MPPWVSKLFDSFSLSNNSAKTESPTQRQSSKIKGDGNVVKQTQSNHYHSHYDIKDESHPPKLSAEVDSPDHILERIRALPLLQQEKFCKTFERHKYTWRLQLRGISQSSSRLQMSEDKDATLGTVWVDVDTQDPKLQDLRLNDVFIVSGTVKEIHGLSIDLCDSTIYIS